MPVYDSKLHKKQTIERIEELIEVVIETIQTNEFERIISICQKIADQLVLLEKRDRRPLTNMFVPLMMQIESNVWKTKKSQRTVFALDAIEDVKRTLHVLIYVLNKTFQTIAIF